MKNCSRYYKLTYLTYDMQQFINKDFKFETCGVKSTVIKLLIQSNDIQIIKLMEVYTE